MFVLKKKVLTLQLQPPPQLHWLTLSFLECAQQLLGLLADAGESSQRTQRKGHAMAEWPQKYVSLTFQVVMHAMNDNADGALFLGIECNCTRPLAHQALLESIHHLSTTTAIPVPAQ